MSFWLWAFSFAYSASFFQYNLCSRLIPLLAALFGVAVIPGSAYRQWRKGRTIPAALFRQATVTVLALCPLALVSFVLSRIPGRCRLSGDDAMGVGIDFAILSAVGLISVVGLAVGLVLREAWRSRARSPVLPPDGVPSNGTPGTEPVQPSERRR